MGAALIPVDLYNPGQVFACLGLLELAERLRGGAAGGFEWSDPGDARFHVRAAGEDDPVAVVLRFLALADVRTQAPLDSELSTDKWKVPTAFLAPGEPFPYALPGSPATLPAELVVGDVRVPVNHWGDSTRRDNVKFWAGSGGYPGAGLLRDALDLLRDQVEGAVERPFDLAAPQSSSFRLDWRRDYVPLGIGFSPNAHGKITPLGYPLVEVLAAIGLTYARPRRKTKLCYHYGVVSGSDLPLLFHRAALGCATLPFPIRSFRMDLDWPGQENQARCITHVSEEIPA